MGSKSRIRLNDLTELNFLVLCYLLIFSPLLEAVYYSFFSLLNFVYLVVIVPFIFLKQNFSCFTGLFLLQYSLIHIKCLVFIQI